MIKFEILTNRSHEHLDVETLNLREVQKHFSTRNLPV